MLFVISDRDVLLDCVPKGGTAIELGVYTGDHAEVMLRTLQCSELHLVDYWQYRPDEHIAFPDVPEHFAGIEEMTRTYMGDDPGATLEKCYAHTVRRFADDPRVSVHRARTYEAVSEFEDAHFDVIYVDANHQYEYVLRDLLEYAPKLKPGGLMILNDHCDSPDGRAQNLGIVGAAATFIKRSGFAHVALSAAPWSDLVITDDPDSEFCQGFIANLVRSAAPIVQLPDSIVANFSHEVLDLGGGMVRHLPSF